MKYKKISLFTDIHFGKHNNSNEHNQDCLDFVDWFCAEVKKDKDIDCIGFLGDWYNIRSSIDIQTLTYSQKAAETLNSLGLPVYFIIGNHDLYQKTVRDIYSTYKFNTLENFRIINEPEIIPELGNGSFLSPYLFHDEYYSDKIQKMFNSVDVCFGHFEFRGFVLTGSCDIRMPTGPEAKDFNNPKVIFSGHFHKRQESGNVVYIGNTFGMDFGDIDDPNRGLCVYDFEKNEYSFTNWEKAPTYTKTTLTEVLDSIEKGEELFAPKTSVKCILDMELTYEQHVYLNEKFKVESSLRSFELVEASSISEALSDTDIVVEFDDELTTSSMDDLIINMLTQVKTKTIDSDKLVDIYKKLVK